MGVSVTTTGRSLSDLLPEGREALLRDLGDLAIRLIRTRTERRIDVHGATFRPLSPGYQKAKTAAGLSNEADLQVSGRMLNDMVIVDVTPSSVAIGFLSAGGTAPRTGRGSRGSTSRTFIQRSRAVGAADKAFFHTEVGAGRSRVKREFFGLSPADEAQIEAAVDRHFDALID